MAIKKQPQIDYWYEFIMTFSNRKSLFSSKKIERFIVFWVFLTLTVVYLMINIRTLESWDFVEISALWLVYGGYNSLMTLRDKKMSNDQSNVEAANGVPNGSESTSGEETSGEEEGDISSGR